MKANGLSSLNIAPSLHKELKRVAATEGRKLQWLVEKLLTDALKARKAA
jgi:hypothetical protein